MDVLGLDYLWKSVISLIVIIWAANYLLRKLSKFTEQGTRNLRIVERMPLSQKSSLCIVKVLDKYYLMSCTEQHNEIIRELEEGEVGSLSKQDSAPRFAQGTQLVKQAPFWKNLIQQGKERGQNIE